MLLTVLLVVLTLLCYLQARRRPKLFPPGPPRLPILGSLPYLAQYPTLYLRMWDLTEKYGDIFGFFVARQPVVVLSRMDLIQQVLKLDAASGRPNLITNSLIRYGDDTGENPTGLSQSKGALWKEQRRFALRHLKEFGLGRASMEDVLLAEAGKLCSSLRQSLDKPTRLGNQLNIRVLNSLWTILVGDKLNPENKQHAEAIHHFNNYVRMTKSKNPVLAAIFPFLVRVFPYHFFKEQMTALTTIKNLTKPIVDEHIMEYDPDNLRSFLDVHIDAQKNASPGSSFHGERGRQNAEVALIDLFMAGSETTSTSITWSIFYLLHHPEVQERLHRELDTVVGRDRTPCLQDEVKLPYLAATIHEIHRSASVVYNGLPHLAVSEIAIDGYVIPKGATVVANVIKVMHNPEVFQDPCTFNPDRFLTEDGKFKSHPHVIPFLVGKRACLGLSLAEKQLFLFLALLLHNFSFHPVPKQQLASYSVKSRDSTSNTLIRFCPSYQLIIRDRNTEH